MKGILCGSLTAAWSGGLLYAVKRADTAHGLPERVSKGAYLLFFLAGCIVPADTMASALSGIMLLTYLCFMAYTDHHTGQVYSFCSYGTGITGFLILLFRHQRAVLPVLLYCVIVIALTLFKAWAPGDMEILIAAAPFLIGRSRSQVYALGGFLLLSTAYFIPYALFICKAGMRGRSAMAPAIAAAAASILWLSH